MKRSERVLYITLIDLLLQLLFLGLVLWVVFGLGYQNPAQLECDDALQQRIHCGKNAGSILQRVAEFLDKHHIDADDASAQIERSLAIIDQLGGPQVAEKLVEELVDLMGDTHYAGRYQEFINQVKTLFAMEAGQQETIDNLGGADLAPEVAEALHGKLGNNSIQDVIDAINGLGDLDVVKALKIASNIEKSGDVDAAEQAVDEQEVLKALTLARKLRQHQLAEPDKLEAYLQANASESGSNNQKPYIEIKDDKDHPHLTFDIGQAALKTQLVEKIDAEAIPFILEAVKKYHVNLVQVIGHTDEQPTSCYKTNASRCQGKMDDELIRRLNAESTDTTQIQGSNVDLGMLRAVEVVKHLKQHLAQAGLTDLYFQPLSAGQTVLADGSLADRFTGTDDAGRRRIEIRVTRKEEYQSAGGQ